MHDEIKTEEEKLPDRKDITLRGVKVDSYNRLRFLAFFWGDLPLGEAFDKAIDFLFECETLAPNSIFDQLDQYPFLKDDSSDDSTSIIVNRFLEAFALGKIPEKKPPKKKKPDKSRKG